MKRNLCSTCALIVALIIAAGCNKTGGVNRLTAPEGELLSVDGKYTLILLSDDTMRRTFGPEWHRLSLFYSSNRAITQDGQRAMITSDLRPLAKGNSILLISGADWPDLIIPIYALETRKQAMFYIDTIQGKITIRPPKPRPGEPMTTPEGHLLFR